ncbi:hypothetical protein IKR20_03890 [bacterium]|nr:hypothetical protein [bacterium]
MKKSDILHLYLAVTLIFALLTVSCGGDSKNDTPDGDTAEPDSDVEEIYGDQEPEPDSDAPSDSDYESSQDYTPSEDFSEGPYGTEYGDIAGDFTLPTEDGEWNFASNYTHDDSYIFVIYRGGSMNSNNKMWSTSLMNLFDASPMNVHYFFAVYTDKNDTFEAKTAEIRENIEEAVSATGNIELRERTHIVSRPLPEIDCWLTRWAEKNSEVFLGIDRFQRLRAGGSFASWQSSTDPMIENIMKEAEYYNYEWELEAFLKENEQKTKKIQGLDGVPFEAEGWTKNIYFNVDFGTFEGNGSLYILFEQLCSDPKDCEWDRLERLFLCDDGEDECSIEIGRWITTYGRSGRWLTDISPLIPLLSGRENARLRLTVDGDNYVNNLDFLYISDEMEQPSEIIRLYHQTEQFTEEYNDKFGTLNFELTDVKKAKIYAFITGHGNGSEKANCAEFCPFESIFSVNGEDFQFDFANAGTSKGCYKKVSDGVVPNQYGSWPYGRAGWCPGLDAKLIEFDVTGSLVSGENTFGYSALLDGKTYSPVVTDPSGYRAEIYLSSYLVIWKN